MINLAPTMSHFFWWNWNYFVTQFQVKIRVIMWEVTHNSSKQLYQRYFFAFRIFENETAIKCYDDLIIPYYHSFFTLELISITSVIDFRKFTLVNYESPKWPIFKLSMKIIRSFLNYYYNYSFSIKHNRYYSHFFSKIWLTF